MVWNISSTWKSLITSDSGLCYHGCLSDTAIREDHAGQCINCLDYYWMEPVILRGSLALATKLGPLSHVTTAVWRSGICHSDKKRAKRLITLDTQCSHLIGRHWQTISLFRMCVNIILEGHTSSTNFYPKTTKFTRLLLTSLNLFFSSLHLPPLQISSSVACTHFLLFELSSSKLQTAFQSELSFSLWLSLFKKRIEQRHASKCLWSESREMRIMICKWSFVIGADIS